MMKQLQEKNTYEWSGIVSQRLQLRQAGRQSLDPKSRQLLLN